MELNNYLGKNSQHGKFQQLPWTGIQISVENDKEPANYISPQWIDIIVVRNTAILNEHHDDNELKNRQ